MLGWSVLLSKCAPHWKILRLTYDQTGSCISVLNPVPVPVPVPVPDFSPKLRDKLQNGKPGFKAKV